MSGYAQRGFDPEVKKFLNFIGVIVGFAGYWVLRALGVPMPVLLIVFVIAVAAGGIGWVIGRILSRFVDGDGAFALFLACSLLVAWFLPPIGIALSIVVCELANTASNRRMFLLCVSFLGFVASFGNASLGASTSFRAQQERMAAASRETQP